MPAVRVVEAFDVVEDGELCFVLVAEASAIEQLAFQRCEEALAHRVVIRVTN